MKTINIKFPLEDDTEKNNLFVLNAVTKDALTSDLLLLLLTEKGQRFYEPEFGTNLRQYIFEPKDNLTINEIEEELRETVRTFIPQLNIKSVQFFDSIDDDGSTVGENELRVLIEFIYTEDVFSEVGRLELTF